MKVFWSPSHSLHPSSSSSPYPPPALSPSIPPPPPFPSFFFLHPYPSSSSSSHTWLPTYLPLPIFIFSRCFFCTLLSLALLPSPSFVVPFPTSFFATSSLPSSLLLLLSIYIYISFSLPLFPLLFLLDQQFLTFTLPCYFHPSLTCFALYFPCSSFSFH